MADNLQYIRSELPKVMKDFELAYTSYMLSMKEPVLKKKYGNTIKPLSNLIKIMGSIMGAGRHGTYEAHIASETIEDAMNTNTNSDRNRRAVVAIVDRNLKKLNSIIKSRLYDLQQMFMSDYKSLWEKLKPSIKELLPVLVNEGSNKLLKRIDESLLIAETVRTGNTQIGKSLIERKYGRKKGIAEIVLNEKKNRYLKSEYVDINKLRKIKRTLNEDTETIDLLNFDGKFDSLNHFKEHLTEGLFLNINKLASDSISIPYGKYMVLVTNNKNTMLIPASEANIIDNEIMDSEDRQYDIHTQDLLRNWNKVERVIGESEEDISPKKGRPKLKAKLKEVGLTKASDMTGIAISTLSNIINNDDKDRGVSFKVQKKLIDAGLASASDFHNYGEVTPYADFSGEPEHDKDSE